MASRIRGWPVTIVAALLPSIGQAQVGTPTRARIDTVTQLPSAARPRQQPAGGRRICVDCGGGFRPERAPAYIIKDSAARVLAMIAPGDTNSAHPYRLIKPEAIASAGPGLREWHHGSHALPGRHDRLAPGYEERPPPLMSRQDRSARRPPNERLELTARPASLRSAWRDRLACGTRNRAW